MLKGIIGSLSRQEKIYLVVLSLVLIGLTLIPYARLLQQTPATWTYAYTTYLNAADNHVYYSLINQSAAGAWLLDNSFTSEKTLPSVRPVWLTIGKIARVLNLSAQTAFHLVRIVLIPVAVFLFYYLFGFFISSQRQRLLASGIFFLTSGQGWMWFLNKPNFWRTEHWSNIPFEFFMPDAFPFSSLLISPHFIVSWILLVGTIVCGYKALVGSRRCLYGSLIMGVFVFFVHPFFLVLPFCIWLTFWLCRTLLEKRVWMKGAVTYVWLMLSVIPAGLYYLYTFYNDPTMPVKIVQNTLPTPDMSTVLFSWGLPVAAALGGYVLMRNFKDVGCDNQYFLVIWLVIGGLLLFAPVPWQRRLVVGWYFPLTILMTYFIRGIYERLRRATAYHYMVTVWLFTPILLFFVLSNTLFIGLNDFFTVNRKPSSFYYAPGLTATVSWLTEHTSEEDILLTNGPAFYQLPGLIHRKVYFAHLVETVYSHSKFNEVSWFFTGDDDSMKRYDFLQSRHIRYIVYNTNAIGFISFQPKTKKYLRLAFESDGYQTYQVITP